MKKIAFYGGSFDPVHVGHLTIARALCGLFDFDEFFFIPAFHAPHKKDKKPTSAFHRHAMLALGTASGERIKISTVELDAPQRPFTFETQTKLKAETDARLFFVIGADSWAEIDTWREWEKVLTLTNIVVVTRPGYEIAADHVTPAIRARIVDLRGLNRNEIDRNFAEKSGERIYITDAVCLDVSATKIRRMISAREPGWQEFVPEEVVGYIEKYELYI